MRAPALKQMTSTQIAKLKSIKTPLNSIALLLLSCIFFGPFSVQAALPSGSEAIVAELKSNPGPQSVALPEETEFSYSARQATLSQYERFRNGVLAYNDEDYITAINIFLNLANEQYVSAQYYVATMFDEGEGTLANYEQSAYWYRRAAENGHMGAQYALGVSYASGHGVPTDMKQAVRWWRAAALQGNINAQYNLGMVYRNGDGVERNFPKAIKWWGEAAKNGDAAAQFNLGVIYANGEGIGRNVCEASRLWQISAEQGFNMAHDALTYVKNIEEFGQCLAVAASD